MKLKIKQVPNLIKRRESLDVAHSIDVLHGHKIKRSNKRNISQDYQRYLNNGKIRASITRKELEKYIEKEEAKKHSKTTSIFSECKIFYCCTNKHNIHD